MACVDYGALLRVNGKFVNKNCDLFMETSDTRYIIDKAYDPKYNQEINIDGNYFVYAGDEKFLLCFYKTYFQVIHNGMIIKAFYIYSNSFDNEEFYFDSLPKVSIQRLTSQTYWLNHYKPDEKDKEWYICYYGKKFGYLKWLRKYKRYCRIKRSNKHSHKVNRFLTTWEHNGNKYEVIFGYGIDNNEEVWNKIKCEYGFFDEEIEIIDKWFA